ncbi:hypothetical protein [Streptomyces mirabilis]|uniref:hypothetical protein n=1 Tax=Streptomyces mirabilis TaxID=68239 RepID=UPI0033A80BE9
MRALRELRPLFTPCTHSLGTITRRCATRRPSPPSPAEYPLLTARRGERSDHARSLAAAGTHRYRRDRVLDALKE